MPRSGADTDPAASDTPARRPRRALRLALVAALASIAFLVSLAATLPVRVVAGYVASPPVINGYSGTVWNGEARLAGGHAFDWRLDLRGSLTGLGLRFDATLTGPGADLAAEIAGSPWARSLQVRGLAGRARWPLVEALAPGLDIACDAAAVVETLEVEIAPGRRSGSGSLRAGPGACLAPGAMAPVPLPALLGRLETIDVGIRGVLSLADAPDEALAEAVATGDDRLLVTVFPAGAALVPGLPTGGEISLEYPLHAWPR